MNIYLATLLDGLEGTAIVAAPDETAARLLLTYHRNAPSQRSLIFQENYVTLTLIGTASPALSRVLAWELPR